MDSLTPAILTIVAGALAGDDALASLAALGQTSHAMKNIVLPVIYETAAIFEPSDEDGAAKLERWIAEHEQHFKYTK